MADDRRLKALLHKIRDGLDRSLDSLRPAPAGSELPDVQVNDEDVKAAALYLRDVGLEYDGLRLHGEFARLQNRCMDEWFASMAEGESQEYRDKLTELFGPFPSQGNPIDSVVADRRVAIVGWIAQLLEFVDELIASLQERSQADTSTTWTSAELQTELDLSADSVNRYANQAGVKTPERGKREFKYDQRSVVQICETIRESTAAKGTKKAAEALLKRINDSPKSA